MSAAYLKTLSGKEIPIFTLRQKVAIQKGKDDKRALGADIFRGIVIGITSRFIVVEKKSKDGSNYKESFKFSDFLCGNIKLV